MSDLDGPHLDPLTSPFWEATSDHRLVIQRCDGCGAHQFPPRPYCLHCLGPVAWVEASGSGTLYSKTTIRIPIGGDVEPPYAVGLVELDEGPRLLGRVVETCAIGDRVAIRWRARPDAPPYPDWGAT